MVCVRIQEVSVLATDCAMMLLDSVCVPGGGGLARLLSQLVDDDAFPANLAALQILHARLDHDALDQLGDGALATLVSSLLKVRARRHYSPSPHLTVESYMVIYAANSYTYLYSLVFHHPLSLSFQT